MSSNKPRWWHGDDTGNGPLTGLDSYWLYVLTGLVFLIGLGLAGVLALWYVQQQAALVPVSTPDPPRKPRISVDPSSGPPGTVVQVFGQDWQVADVVFISLEAPFAASTWDFAHAGAVIDEDGQFKVNFPFPEDDRWQNTGAMKVVAWAEESGEKAVTIYQVLSAAPVAMGIGGETATPVSDGQAGPGPTSNLVADSAAPPLPAETPAAEIPAENWYGEYFDNPTLDGSPVFFRDDGEIRFDWVDEAPGENVKADGFSARWTRYVPFEAGVYRFFAQADDGVRLWVDDRLVLDQWHEGSPTTYVADTYLWEGKHRLRVEYYEREETASVRFWWERLEVFPDWKGEYFDNADLAGQPTAVRNDSEIRFSWGEKPPAQGIRPQDFSARWTRRVRFGQGRYRFYVNADTGMRVWLDSDLIVDSWRNDGTGLRTADLSLGEGEYRIRVDYFNDGGDARAEFWWEQLAVTPTAPLPTSIAVPMAAGPITPTTESASPMEMFSSSLDRSEADVVSAGEPGVMLNVPLPETVAVSTTASPPITKTEGTTLIQSDAGGPAMEVEPSEAAPGAEVIVRGRRWTPGEETVLSLVEPGGNLDQASPFATALADEDGRFEVKIPLPDGPEWLEYGELMVFARNVDWSLRVVSPLRIVPPEPINELQPFVEP